MGSGKSAPSGRSDRGMFHSPRLFHVNAVVEINVIGKIVNLGPLDRLIRSEAFPYGLQRRTVDPDLRVAVHARLGRRNHCPVRVLNRSVQ